MLSSVARFASVFIWIALQLPSVLAPPPLPSSGHTGFAGGGVLLLIPWLAWWVVRAGIRAVRVVGSALSSISGGEALPLQRHAA